MNQQSQMIETLLTPFLSQFGEPTEAYLHVLRLIVEHLKKNQPRMFHDDFYEDAIGDLAVELALFNVESDRIMRGEK